MPRFIELEIKKFHKYFNKLEEKYRVVKPGDNMYVVSPKSQQPTLPKSKNIALTIGAITHGNESAGIGTVNDFLAYLSSGVINLELPLAFILGNTEAALQEKRFIERDLNRSFSSPRADEQKTKEEKRALAIQAILSQTAWFIDLHQTTLPSEEAFFIFPYAKASYSFARNVAPHQPIITHWGDGFSEAGMCSDEYVNSQGGVGITLELGQNGLRSYHIGIGCSLLVSALAYVQKTVKQSNHSPALSHFEELSSPEWGALYTFADIIPYPKTGLVQLVPGLYNFSAVKKGTKLADLGDSVLTAPEDRRLLFPTYLDPHTPSEKRPTELLRLLKQIEEPELPQ